MDNDMVLLGNIDELAEHAEAPGMVRVRVRVMWRRGPWLTLTLTLTLTEAPGMVWHTATVLARKERSAVTGGMFVLKPDAAEYARALHHLYHELNRLGLGLG